MRAGTLALLLSALPWSSFAQDQDRDSEQLVSLQFLSSPIPAILLEYERLTGAQVIRDASIQDRNLSIQTSGKLTRQEAAQFIEKSFLLNGFAIVPTEVAGQKKIIAFSESRSLSSEGLPVITNPLLLPDEEQVVTFLMPLQHISPEDAAKAFGEIIDLHAYGKIVALESASALVITENTPTIRSMLALRDQIDRSPVRTLDGAFSLERADAEEVVEALIDILELDSSETGASGTTSGGSSRDSTSNNETREQIAAAALPAGARGSLFADATKPKPKVRAITRTNSVLVVATPDDMTYISNLIDHLDAPVERARFMQRKLNYIPVANFLPIARDTLQRGIDTGDEQSEISGGENATGQNTLNATNGTNVNQDDSFSRTGSSSATGSASFGVAGQDEDVGPQSVVIDKTLLIADNAQNMLLASGPPEHLEIINELLDVMDTEVPQIQISAIIAQLNLRNDFEFGFDFLRSLPPDAQGFDLAGVFQSRTGTAQSLVDVSGLTDVANLLPTAAQGFTAYGRINTAMDLVLSALESTNRFKVLSRPTVYTQNNKQAVIQTGQRVAVPRSTLSSLDVDGNNNNQVVTANIDFENVLLRIEVRPLINNNGQITLRINQSNDDIIGSQVIGGDEIPTIGTQALGTTIMIPDGGTVLLGGLISEEESKAESGLPLFTSLPFVGRVFGSTNDDIQRQELLIFIQPRVISYTGEYERADEDMIRRTEVGEPAGEFADGTRDNMTAFQSEEYRSPQKRIHFFKEMFRKVGKTKTPAVAQPAWKTPPNPPPPDAVARPVAQPQLRAIPMQPAE